MGLDGQSDGFFGDFWANSGKLKKNVARTNDGDVARDIGFTRTHTGAGGFFGDRFVGKDPQVNPADALGVVGDGAASRFDLSGGDPTTFEGLEAMLAKGNSAASDGSSGHGAPEFFSIFSSARL